jgi:hypothetical protein
MTRVKLSPEQSSLEFAINILKDAQKKFHTHYTSYLQTTDDLFKSQYLRYIEIESHINILKSLKDNYG